MTRASTRSSAQGGKLFIAMSGLGLWAVCFVVLYGTMSVGCDPTWVPDSQRSRAVLISVLILLWLAFVGALTWLVRREWRAGQGLARSTETTSAARFMHYLALLLHGAALLATIALGVPVFLLDPCV